MAKHFDLSDKSSCMLMFQNKRYVPASYPLPTPLQGQTNDRRCHVLLIVQGTAISLATFSNSTSDWVTETIPLTPYVGASDVRLGFKIYQHATSGSPSTTWHIDDITIVGN